MAARAPVYIGPTPDQRDAMPSALCWNGFTVTQLDPCLSRYATPLAEDGTPLPDGTLRICHRLVWDPIRSVLVQPGGEEHANWKLTQARERLAELEQRGDWNEAILAHRPCYRLAALERYAETLADEQYWQLVAVVWVEDRSPSAARSQRWLRVLESARPGRDDAMMNDEERNKHRRLSASVRVFRGFDYEGGECGLGWTLCRDVATRFARQGEKRGTQMVAEGHIDRDSIIALLHRVEEAEVIANPEDVRIEAISPA